LRAALDDLEREFPGSKILIFTESRDTLEYLEKRIKSWGYRTCTIHGGMRIEERIQAESIFKHEAQILVATEAAGEGINLQFCNLMINYDIPWNPNRLEQRMGRIHRYGQVKEVFIFNLVAADTREGRVLKRLFDKLDEIRNALGTDKVFDILGDVLQGRELSELMVQAAASARGIDDILRDLDIELDETYLEHVRQSLGESLATRYIDYTGIREMADAAREHRLIPEYTEAFFKKAMDAAGGRWRDRTLGEGGSPHHFIALDSMPYEIRQIARADTFRRSHGQMLDRYPLVTFDKEIAYRFPEAEFVSFGHPLFEATLAWIERSFSGLLQKGAVFTDPDGQMEGLLLFYEGEVKDGRGQIAGKRLFAILGDPAGGEFAMVNPAMTWDLNPGGDTTSPQDMQIETMKAHSMRILLPDLEAYCGELRGERERQAGIKEKYGVKSLEHLIVTLDGDIINLYARKEQGENVDLPIHNKEVQKREYEDALKELRSTIEQERNLTISMPRFIGALWVCPAHVSAEEMSSDPAVEQVGMEMALAYEEAQGRIPEDVSADNLGFDIRSRHPKSVERRYIEVKARAKSGPVALTQNEWFKARRFADEYYLYVVLKAAKSPELHILQDPASILEPEEKVEVRYLVDLKDILGKGERVTL
jgi:hypothetical protein